jgi:hypothetical protein
MFDFDAFADLTASFNGAMNGFAHTAALGMSVATVFSLASDRAPKKDGVEHAMKSVAKLSLLGMML